MAGEYEAHRYFQCDCCRKMLPDDLLTGFPDVMCVKCYNGESYDYIIKSLREAYDKRYADAEQFVALVEAKEADRRKKERDFHRVRDSVAPLW